MRFETYWKYIKRPQHIIRGKFRDIFWGKFHTDKSIQKFVNKHRGQLVWEPPCQVVKLIGWTDQCEEDYYYIVANGYHKISLFSCVIGLYPIKGLWKSWAYRLGEERMEMNCPQEWIDEEIKKRKYKVK